MIESLKDLEKLLRMCRKQGVNKIKLKDIEFELGDLPLTAEQIKEQQIEDERRDPWANFPPGELTPEQLAYYSSGGMPENDPDNKDVQ